MVLETELQLDEIAAAREFFQKLESMLETIRRSLYDTSGLPEYRLNYLRQKLQGLDRRVKAIAARLKRGTRGSRLHLMAWPLTKNIHPGYPRRDMRG